MTRYKTIRITKETYEELTKILGIMMYRDPTIKTYDKVIKKLIDIYKSHEDIDR